LLPILRFDHVQNTDTVYRTTPDNADKHIHQETLLTNKLTRIKVPCYTILNSIM